MSSGLHDPRRVLSVPSLHNIRDLGGYPTADGAATRWRSLLRADDPAQLTPAGLQALEELGLETVIDLRWPEEVAASPSPLPRRPRIRYRHISLLAQSQQTWGRLSGEGPKENWKCLVLTHVAAELREVLLAIAESTPGPLLFHCVAGKDRTGVIAALLLALADVTPEAVAYDYAVSAEHLREAYLTRYANRDRAEILEALRGPPEGAHRMLDYLESRGGIRNFLRRIGLSEPHIVQLRARLRD
jgi:protein-tyrosine phosphatase